MKARRSKQRTPGLVELPSMEDFRDEHADRMRKILGGTASRGEKPEKMGICRVCQTPTVKIKWVTEPFTMHTPIGPPLSRHQDGAFCTNCGLCYAFMPPDPPKAKKRK